MAIDDDEQSTRPRRRWRRWATLSVLAIGLVLLVYAVFVEPARLDVQHTELEVPGLRVPLRVAVLTDLHVGAPHIDHDKLAEVVDRTNAEAPDVVVVLGDLVIHGVWGGEFVEPEPIAAELGRLRAPLGVFAVLGNHDWWYDGLRVHRALADAGLVVLENDARGLTHADAPLWIAGVADLWTRHVDVEAALVSVPAGEPALLLTHSPDIFPEVPSTVSITLAGHTHGGQVRVPFLGPPVVPSTYGRRYAEGHVVEDGRHLFVSTGVGTSILPVRFLVVPRIDILDLG